MFCFDKTRILVLDEVKMIALKQSNVVIYNIHNIHTYMRCKYSNIKILIYYGSQIKMKH